MQLSDLHTLAVRQTENAESLYLDGMRIKGLTGYRIESRLDGTEKHVKLALELHIPKLGLLYESEGKSFDIAAPVIPSATADIADRE